MIAAHGLLLASLQAGLARAPEPAPEAVAAPRAAAPEGERQLIDYPLGIVHDRLITRVDFERLLFRNPPPEEVKTPEERERYEQGLFEKRRDELLQVLAARDIFPREGVENHSRQRFDEVIEAHGGRVQASDYLREHGWTADQVREDLEENDLRRFWKSAVTGRIAGPSGRVSADRFVRPGELHAFYQLELANPQPGWIKLLGGEQERAVLQVLILPVDQQGTTAALLRAKEIARQVEDGEDFSRLVRAFSVKAENDGILQAHPLHALASIAKNLHGDDELLRFVREAVPGDLSEPMLTAESSPNRPAVHLYRLLERLPARIPDFVDRDAQEAIEKELLELMDERRLEGAMNRLRRAYYDQVQRGRNGPEEADDLDSSPPGP